jgi:glutamate/tyrosine decarboxylase-like PLP-dependent enzyme
MNDLVNPVQEARLKVHNEYFRNIESVLQLRGTGGGIPEAWFLGPKAENESVLLELIVEAVCRHSEFRRDFHPEDPVFITKELKRSAEYVYAIDSLRHHASALFDELQKSVPFFSMRYQSHMLWDQALPAMVGYFGAMLYNQNNVAAEASPLTTYLEIQVGNDLCQMLGFRSSGMGGDAYGPWGHITCDGSVANIEALWAARNAKFYAIALREALRHNPALSPARDIEVSLLNGEKRQLIGVDDPWILLNLKIDDVVSLPWAMKDKFGIDPSVSSMALGSYAVQNTGLVEFYSTLLPSDIRTPAVMVPATRHYSWPKAAALLGLGQNNVRKIPVDLQGRMSVAGLKDELERCLTHRIPVIAVVAVIGSTEESAVDPLHDILELRSSFRERGLDFAVHCDAAYGGYFNCARITPPPALPETMQPLRSGLPPGAAVADEKRAAFLAEVPALPMSQYVDLQFAALAGADSITVDPHKAGYVPYPAGAICYRNSNMRDLISLKAPVIFHNENEPTVGIYGVEGSKPGAAAAAVWLAHKVIPPNQAGYGKILGQCMWTSTRLYCRLVTLRERDPNHPRYKLVLFQMLPAERNGGSEHEISAQREYIRKNFVHRTNDDLLRFLKHDEYARELFADIGSDLAILAYTFNFADKSGAWNTDVHKLQKLNEKIFELCSVTNPQQGAGSRRLILTSSSFDIDSYGESFVADYCRRLNVTNTDKIAIPFLISTTMDPWTTDIPGHGDFLDEVENALRETVNHVLADPQF